MALEYLKGKGYEIIAQNYRNPYGEIDIIARKDGAYIFCEVKFRKNERTGDPLEAVDRRKQRRISRTALGFYKAMGLGESDPCRFDVIGVRGDGRMTHIENAFMFCR